jgi:hypothetical protein
MLRTLAIISPVFVVADLSAPLLFHQYNVFLFNLPMNSAQNVPVIPAKAGICRKAYTVLQFLAFAWITKSSFE